MARTPRYLLAATLVLGVVAQPGAAHAATITVNTPADEDGAGGNCSLREAVQAANTDAAFGGCTAGSGPDTIAVPAGTYVLTVPGPDENLNGTGDLDVATAVTIDPTGAVVIDGGALDRVIHVLAPAGALTVSDLTIRRGSAPGMANGGGIFNEGSVTVTGVTLTDNEAQSGGAIATTGSATLVNDTLSANRARVDGGGLFQAGGTATVNNLTIADNTADNDANDSGNGGGIAVGGGTLAVANTLVGNNRDASTPANLKHADCSGTVASQGYNLVEDTAGCTLAGTTTGNVTGEDPRLEGLAANGGPTATHALRKNSPAVNAGNPAASGAAACAATDQRGVARPQGPRCDIGSFELEQPAGAGPQCLGRSVTIAGTTGNDTLMGTPGPDSIQAKAGNDSVSALPRSDTVCAGPGMDSLRGGPGPDRVGGQGDDDRAGGGPGPDAVSGNAGNDRLRGARGRDRLFGGGGNDALNGGPGFDVCRGGPGVDRFRRCERTVQ
jgi:CSLREA domain-containing protein